MTFFTRNTQRKPKRKNDMPLEIQIQKNIAGQGAGAVNVKLAGSLDIEALAHGSEETLQEC